MKEPEIVVLSGENRFDQWKNFLFKDKTGKEYKIGAKRNNKDQIANLVAANANRAVKLIWDVYFREGTEYDIIGSIELVEDGLPEPEKPKPQPIPQIDTPPSKSRDDLIRENMEWKDQQINEKFWYGQLGESLRSGLIDRSTPAGKLLEKFYKAEMQSALHFKIEKGE